MSQETSQAEHLGCQTPSPSLRLFLIQPILSTYSLQGPHKGPGNQRQRGYDPVLRDLIVCSGEQAPNNKAALWELHKVYTQTGGYAWVESERSTAGPTFTHSVAF